MLGKPEIVKGWNGKDQNVYRREVLYQEIWNFPVTEVAKKYAVSDVAIHKVCKSMDIPTPPAGYWAKRRAGKEVTVPPLPQSSCCSVKYGLRTQKEATSTSNNTYVPSYMLAYRMAPAAIGATEEEMRKREEERQRLEERRKQYKVEAAKTKELLNQADDFEIACKIRAMVAAAEQNGTASAEWIAWAKAKADWYDPTVAARDECFGRRNHKQSAEQKAFRE